MNQDYREIWIVILSSIGAGNTTFVKAVVLPSLGHGGRRLSEEEERQWKLEGRSRPYGWFKFDDANNVDVHVIGVYPIDMAKNVLKEEEIIPLQRKMGGVILLLDSSRPETFLESTQLLHEYLARKQVPFFVVANKQDKPDALSTDEIRSHLRFQENLKIYPCIATNKQIVETIVFELVEMIISESPAAPR